MDMRDNNLRPFKTFVLIYVIFLILCSGANCQNVICNSVESDTTNVFDSYNVTVNGFTNYNLSYEPVEYGPNMRMPVGTTNVTVTANSASPLSEIGSCTFNVTVNLSELPIECPPPLMDLTVGTDLGQPFYTYPDPVPFNVTYQPESLTYVPYDKITMVRMGDPRLAISQPLAAAYTVKLIISDGTLEKSCTEARVIVEDREPPIFVCPDDIVQNDTTVGDSFFVENITDNSGVPVDIAVVPFPRGNYSVGTTTYTFTALDGAGNNASCSFNVTVELAPLTPTTQEPTNTMESPTAGPQNMPDNLPIIIGCSVAGAVLLLIIIILAVFCSSPGRRSIFGIGPKEPRRLRQVGVSRHGVATDPVLLNDRLERTRSNLYASTNIDSDVEMEESPEMTETDGATGGLKDMMDTNGMHVNEAYTGETCDKSDL